jgi:hypothetical protein
MPRRECRLQFGRSNLWPEVAKKLNPGLSFPAPSGQARGARTYSISNIPNPSYPSKRRVPMPANGDGRGFRTAKAAEGVVIPIKRPRTGRHLNEIDELPIAGTDIVEA